MFPGIVWYHLSPAFGVDCLYELRRRLLAWLYLEWIQKNQHNNTVASGAVLDALTQIGLTSGLKRVAGVVVACGGPKAKDTRDLVDYFGNSYGNLWNNLEIPYGTYEKLNPLGGIRRYMLEEEVIEVKKVAKAALLLCANCLFPHDRGQWHEATAGMIASLVAMAEAFSSPSSYPFDLSVPYIENQTGWVEDALALAFTTHKISRSAAWLVTLTE